MHLLRHFAVVTLLLAPVASADPVAAQEDFSGKFLCVEDGTTSWAIGKARVSKVGSREFLVGDQVPPPAKPEIKTGAPAAAKGKDTRKGEAPKTHCKTMIPLEKVQSIQVFDSERDLNDYFDSLDDTGNADDDKSVVY